MSDNFEEDDEFNRVLGSKNKDKTQLNSTLNSQSSSNNLIEFFPDNLRYKMDFNDDDIKSYMRLAEKKSKQKKYIQSFTSTYKIEGLSSSSILIYHIIRNEVSLHKLVSNEKTILATKNSKDTTQSNSDAIKKLRIKLVNRPLSDYPTEISINEFQKYNNFSHHTINLAIQQLEDYGLIQVVKQGKTKPNLYILLENMEYLTIPEIENIFLKCLELNYDSGWVKGLAYLIEDKDKLKFAHLVQKYKRIQNSINNGEDIDVINNLINESIEIDLDDNINFDNNNKSESKINESKNKKTSKKKKRKGLVGRPRAKSNSKS